MKNVIKKIMISVFTVAMIVVTMYCMKIQHVEVTGNARLSDLDVVSAIFEKEIDKNAILFLLKEKFGKHKKINYVSDYYVEWNTPFSISIDVHEKPSIAYVRCDLKNVYFDKDGIINDVTDDKKNGIIEVSGITFDTYEKGKKISAKDKKSINAILNITSRIHDNNLPARYLEISKNGDISVFIGDVTVVLGDTRNMEIKLQRLNDIYREVANLKGTLYLNNARENMLDEQYIFKKVD